MFLLWGKELPGPVYWLKRITTIYFYMPNQGTGVEWFSCSILLLYFLFPFLFYFTMRVKQYVLFFYLISAILVISYPNMEWYHNCFISRIGIFCFGILSYFYYKRESSVPIAYIYFLAAFSFPFFFVKQFYLATALFCPLFIGLISRLLTLRFKCNFLILAFSLIGQYTLEFFYGNNCAATIFYHFYGIFDSWICQLLYVFSNILFATFFIQINKMIKHVIPFSAR